jgi:hypothetical protein
MFFLFLTSLNLISSLSSLTFLNVSLSLARQPPLSRPPLPCPAGPVEHSVPAAAPAPGRPRPRPCPPPTRKATPADPVAAAAASAAPGPRRGRPAVPGPRRGRPHPPPPPPRLAPDVHCRPHPPRPRSSPQTPLPWPRPASDPPVGARYAAIDPAVDVPDPSHRPAPATTVRYLVYTFLFFYSMC